MAVDNLTQHIKDRIAYHSNNHRHYYELGKGVVDYLANDLIADFVSFGYKKLALKPGDSCAADCDGFDCDINYRKSLMKQWIESEYKGGDEE